MCVATTNLNGRLCRSIEVNDNEDNLLSLLSRRGPAGSNLAPREMRDARSLIRDLERSGGSQIDLADGVGSYELPWLGAWDVMYVDAAILPWSPALTQEIMPVLTSANFFVYGPSDAAADLRGQPVEGGAAIEYTYAAGENANPSILLSSVGGITKLPGMDYKMNFMQISRMNRPPNADSRSAPGSPLSLTSSPDSLAQLSSKQAATRYMTISYLSERLWVSHTQDDDMLLVLSRSDAKSLLPPKQRPDLTSVCAEAAFVRGQTCRRERLF